VEFISGLRRQLSAGGAKAPPLHANHGSIKTTLSRRDPALGGMAVLLGVRTGIHPEGFILKDKPCPYIEFLL